MKTFLLTDIPEELHRQWKMYAVAIGMSMKDFCLNVLNDRITALKKEGAKDDGD